MLNGKRYFSEFPDEDPGQMPRLVMSDELLVTLAAIEREISAFMRGAAGKTAGTIVASNGDRTDSRAD
jgi:hypothetical protein